MKELANFLVVFLLNLIASNSGPTGQPQPESMTLTEECAQHARSVSVLEVDPVIEFAPVLISVPMTRELVPYQISAAKPCPRKVERKTVRLRDSRNLHQRTYVTLLRWKKVHSPALQ